MIGLANRFLAQAREWKRLLTGDASVIMRQRIGLLAALALASVASAAGYYLPGTYPQEFVVGQQLQGKFARQACKTTWVPPQSFRCRNLLEIF